MIVDIEGLPEKEAKKILDELNKKDKEKVKMLDTFFNNDDFCEIILNHVKKKKIENVASKTNFWRLMMNIPSD